MFETLRRPRFFARFLPAMGLFCLLSALPVVAGEAAEAVEASSAAPQVYGEGVGQGAMTPIAKIVADPDAFAGQEVRVKGVVAGVCPMRGCWMELRDGKGAALRVKVKDGVIVFPEDAEGHNASARGVVSVQDMSREQYLGWVTHLAEEKGETFDESTLGEGPFRRVQLTGVGAEIQP